MKKVLNITWNVIQVLIIIYVISVIIFMSFSNKYGYSQHLLYFALKDDLENTKQYKDIIEKQLKEHDKYLGRFVEYDVLGAKIKELAEGLNKKTSKTDTKENKKSKKKNK